MQRYEIYNYAGEILGSVKADSEDDALKKALILGMIDACKALPVEQY